MNGRRYLPVLLAVGAGLWGLALVLQGTHVSASFFRPFSIVEGALLLFVSVFELWAWRIRWLHPWFVSVPDVHGTWKGEIVSKWADRAEGATRIEAYLVVRQTFSSISVRQLTGESRSELLAGNVTRSRDGIVTLTGTYQNEPDLSVRERSSIHFGAFKLQVMGRPPNRLEGHYWTDRETKGTMRFGVRTRTLFDSFEDSTKHQF